MLSEKSKFKPDPEVICSTLDNGETVLLHAKTGCYFSLNGTGSLIWQCIGEGSDLEEIGRKLVDQYEVSDEEALQSVFELVEDMLDQKLISPSIPG
jgi:hypothetical protein